MLLLLLHMFSPTTFQMTNRPSTRATTIRKTRNIFTFYNIKYSYNNNILSTSKNCNNSNKNYNNKNTNNKLSKIIKLLCWLFLQHHQNFHNFLTKQLKQQNFHIHPLNTTATKQDCQNLKTNLATITLRLLNFLTANFSTNPFFFIIKYSINS